MAEATRREGGRKKRRELGRYGRGSQEPICPIGSLRSG